MRKYYEFQTIENKLKFDDIITSEEDRNTIENGIGQTKSFKSSIKGQLCFL